MNRLLGILRNWWTTAGALLTLAGGLLRLFDKDVPFDPNVVHAIADSLIILGPVVVGLFAKDHSATPSNPL